MPDIYTELIHARARIGRLEDLLRRSAEAQSDLVDTIQALRGRPPLGCRTHPAPPIRLWPRAEAR